MPTVLMKRLKQKLTSIVHWGHKTYDVNQEEMAWWAHQYYDGTLLDIALQVIRLICTQTNISSSQLCPETGFMKDMNIYDDFNILRLIAEIETIFNVDLSEEDCRHIHTVDDCILFLAKAL